MYLCARIAVCSGGGETPGGYYGRDIVIRSLSETGFEADTRFALSEGAIVRLRLPGAGNVLARILDSAGERLFAEFVNPLGRSRLNMALGMRQAVTAAA
jgi:hypothetical protein